MASAELDNVFAPHETLGYALKRAQHAMRQNMDRQLKAFNLSAPQYAVLVSLEVEPGASNAHLARRAFVTPQTMQAMLVKLEKAGFIRRMPDTEHGRIQKTLLTSLGKEKLALAHAVAFKSEQLACDAASEDAIAMLGRVADALS